MTRTLTTLVLLVLVAGALRAQDADSSSSRPNLHAVGRSFGDSIVIRWGTTTHTAWKVAGAGGYSVERTDLTTIRRNGGDVRVLNASPLKPLSIDGWKARFRPEDTLAGAAVQALYGRPVVTSDDPFGSIYEMYLQQRNVFGFALLLADMSPAIADGMALRFVDRTVEKGHTYVYRIYSHAANRDEPIDTATVMVTAGDDEPTRSVTTLRAEESELLVTLAWDRFEHITPFSGYFIERSVDGGRTYQRINRLPFIAARDANGDGESTTIEYRVPQEANYRAAHYRVVGVDAFGELSPNSTAIVAMGRDRLAPRQPQMNPVTIVDGTSVGLSWRLDSVDGDLKGFVVGRSLDVEGPFEPIGEMLPPAARSWTDRNVSAEPGRYYTVVAVDTAGNERSSVPMLAIFPDSIAPVTPIGLRGVVDSTGVVRLSWSGNRERDLQGYRVFYANQDDHEYQQLTTDITTDTTFVDTLTLETLSEEIYYKVTALDRNFNHSPFTVPLVLDKPDIVAPVAPVVVDVESVDGGVRLAWYRSPSGDIAEHALFRREGETGEWTRIASSRDAAFASWVDTTTTRGVYYEYSLVATDDDGLGSLRSNIVGATAFATASIPAPAAVNGEIDRGAGRIVVRWSGAPSRGSLHVYKGTGDGELSLYRALESGAIELGDSEVVAGTTYRYGIKIVADDGGESPMVTTAPISYN